MWSWGAGGLSQGWVSEGAGLSPDFTLSGYWSLGSHEPLRALLGCSHSGIQEAQIPLRDWSELTQVVNSGGGITSGSLLHNGALIPLPLRPSFPASSLSSSHSPTPPLVQVQHSCEAICRTCSPCDYWDSGSRQPLVSPWAGVAGVGGWRSGWQVWRLLGSSPASPAPCLPLKANEI